MHEKCSSNNLLSGLLNPICLLMILSKKRYFSSLPSAILKTLKLIKPHVGTPAMYLPKDWPCHRIEAFPYYCPGARRGNVFVATWLLRPRPRSTSIVLYISTSICEFNCDHVTSPREVFCLVFDLWLFLMLRRPRCFFTTTVLFLTEQFKKKIRKKGSFPDRASFRPVERRHPELGSWLGKASEGVVSLPSSGSKSCVRHLTSESMSQDLNRRERLRSFNLRLPARPGCA